MSRAGQGGLQLCWAVCQRLCVAMLAVLRVRMALRPHATAARASAGTQAAGRRGAALCRLCVFCLFVCGGLGARIIGQGAVLMQGLLCRQQCLVRCLSSPTCQLLPGNSRLVGCVCRRVSWQWHSTAGNSCFGLGWAVGDALSPQGQQHGVVGHSAVACSSRCMCVVAGLGQAGGALRTDTSSCALVLAADSGSFLPDSADITATCCFLCLCRAARCFRSVGGAAGCECLQAVRLLLAGF